VLGLGDHASRTAPAVQRAPSEVGEPACRAALCQALSRGPRESLGEGADQALVACEAKYLVGAVRLAPRHQLLAGKARIGPQHDLNPRPARPDLRDDPRHLLDGAS
jgi:hypothetical protein